jgi:hypothetical protein
MLRLLGVVGPVGSCSSERNRRREPKNWLKFEDVVNCRDAESFNAFVEQFLSERGLVGEDRKRTYWALFYAWKNATYQCTQENEK